MKKFFSALLALPSLCFSSHSVDLGAFYSTHSEPGYRYNLGGPSIAYEIGNSKGLKTVGKVLFSSNSDLIFLQSRTEFRWYIPYKNFEVFPMWGAYSSYHQVTRSENVVGVLTRTQAPFGAGFKHCFGDLSYKVCVGHLFPIGSTIIYVEDASNFYGNKIYLRPSYFAEGTIEYQTPTNFKANLNVRYTGDYKQRSNNLVVEITGTYKF